MQLAHDIPRYWTNFAKTGDPNGPGLPQWPDYRRTQQVLQFSDATTSVPLPGREEHALVDAYLSSLSQEP